MSVFQFSASLLFAVAVGFTASGIGASSYALFTNQRLRFEEAGRGMVVPRALLLLVSGPVILIRNSWKAAVRGLRPRYWLLLSAVVALSWSLCIGLVVLNLAAMIGGA